MRRVLLCTLMLVSTLLPAFAQKQNYLHRVGVFTGFSYLSTPSINLNQRGFNGSGGVNLNRWLEIGADFSIVTGSTNLALRKTKLGPAILPTIPPAFLPLVANAAAPVDAKTYTFAAGPQFNLRKWEHLTLWARPGFGLFHFVADVNLTSLAPLSALGVTLTGVSPHMTDTVAFVGVGGGLDVDVSRHVGFRFSADLVHANPFSNILNSQNELRLGIGPRWRFGEVK